jgi:general secretion pathway protein H
LVVVLIISLISALVMPRMAASLPGVQLKSTTRAVAAALRYARSKAVSESRPYVAIFDTNQKLLAVEPMDKPTDTAELNRLGEILNTSNLQKVYEIPNEIEMGVSNNNAADEGSDVFAIFFFPRGDSTGGKIVLQNPSRRQFTVTVDRITGMVEIAEL